MYVYIYKIYPQGGIIKKIWNDGRYVNDNVWMYENMWMKLYFILNFMLLLGE